MDITYVSSLKALNVAYSAIYKEQLFPAETLKTFNQKKHEGEIIVLKKTMVEKTVYPQFCKATAEFIDEFIPKFIAEKCSMLPPTVEKWILYQLWYSARYLNHQLSKRLNYQAALSNSFAGKCFQELFLGLRTHAAHAIAGKNSLNALINFEHVLLQVCSKVAQTPSNPNMNLIAALVKSLADSLSQQNDIDTELHQFLSISEEEAFIVRLEWHRENNTLPKGLPDPQQGETHSAES